MWFIFFLSGAINTDFQVERDINLIPYVIAHYKIPYSDVTFYKKDTLYEARYISVLVVKKGKHQIGGMSNKEKIVLKNYLETISPNKSSAGTLKEELTNGDYKVILNIWDLQSNRRWSWEEDIEIPEIEPLDIGSIQWFSDPSHIISARDTVRVNIIVFDKGKVGGQLSYYYRSSKGGIYSKTDTLLEGSKRYLININLGANQFPENMYKLVVQLKDTNGREIRERSIDFEIREPFFQSKMFFERVRELTYIATTKEMDELLNAKVEERKELWQEFWRERDPTSGDEINEFKEEYFRKIDYVQEHFSTGLTEGWKSDRGKAYMLLGPPDYVERHPFEMEGKAYEIWYYYIKDYRLVFVEQYNLGEYKLINPPRGF